MAYLSRILPAAATAAILCWSPSLAADYEPPIVIDEAPEYVPVEIGSGWYLRGDVTYTFNESVYDIAAFGLETENLYFGGGVGIGYHFNDFFRADLNIGFVGRDRFAYDDGVDAVSAENSVWSGMLNGYVDLGTFAGFTPYVGAGAGLLYSSQEIAVNSGTFGVTFAADDREYAFAYALHAGVNYQLTKNVSVDVGYQYLNSPDMNYFDVNTATLEATMEDGMDFHQIKVGLRYDLW